MALKTPSSRAARWPVISKWARIAEGCIDFLIFFWDPLEPLSHDPDVKALLRMAVVWNIPLACNRASADFLISSPLVNEEYLRKLPDYENYRQRLKTHDRNPKLGVAHF